MRLRTYADYTFPGHTTWSYPRYEMPGGTFCLLQRGTMVQWWKIRMVQKKHADDFGLELLQRNIDQYKQSQSKVFIVFIVLELFNIFLAYVDRNCLY